MSVNDMAMQNVHLHHFLKAWDEIALWDTLYTHRADRNSNTSGIQQIWYILRYLLKHFTSKEYKDGFQKKICLQYE
jgi:hypothetical protein